MNSISFKSLYKFQKINEFFNTQEIDLGILFILINEMKNYYFEEFNLNIEKIFLEKYKNYILMILNKYFLQKISDEK